jgi:monovalent cation:H+ antiporter-2, CPA2 family
VVGRSDFSLRAAADALPMRDAFAVLFFVSVGMLFHPKAVLETPITVVATILVVMVGKPLAALLLVLFMGYPVRTALAVAVALGQIGEFSFILAALGTKLGVLPPEATNALVVAAIVSISANPLLFRTVGWWERWLRGKPRLERVLTRRSREALGAEPPRPEEADPRYRAVVIGYGPVGRTLVRLLKENDITPTVIEMNIDTVRALRAAGIDAVYGDATHRDTLKQAGVAEAANLVMTSSGMKGAEEVIHLAREFNAEIRVLARSAYLADEVFAGEGEVALALTESLMRALGAGPEQIDRERERVRKELFGTEN